MWPKQVRSSRADLLPQGRGEESRGAALRDAGGARVPTRDPMDTQAPRALTRMTERSCLTRRGLKLFCMNSRYPSASRRSFPIPDHCIVRTYTFTKALRIQRFPLTGTAPFNDASTWGVRAPRALRTPDVQLLHARRERLLLRGVWRPRRATSPRNPRCHLRGKRHTS